MRKAYSIAVVSVICSLALGCRHKVTPPGDEQDAGVSATDGGVSNDAGGAPDAGTPDAGGAPDAGSPDDGGHSNDAGGVPDAGTPDAGTPDAGTPDAGPPPVIESFNASPSQLGPGGGDVTLSWSVTGASSLSINQGVGTVTGTSTSVHVTTGKSWILTATNAGGSVTGTTSVTINATLTVSGHLVFKGGRPVIGKQVIVIGHPATVTDSSGAFSVSNVQLPYDIAWVDDVSTAAAVYKGVNRGDPTLVYWGYEPNLTQRAVEINASLAGYQEEQSGWAWVESPVGNINYPASSGSFSRALFWLGSPVSSTCRVGAIQKTQSGGLPTAWTGFADSHATSITSGTPLNLSLTYGPIPSHTVSGTVSVPTDYTVAQKTAYLSFGGTPQGARLVQELDSATTFSYLLPLAPDAVTLLETIVTSNDAGGTSVYTPVAANDSSLNIQVPPPPVLTFPSSNAVNVRESATFSWSAFQPTGSSGHAVHVLTFTPSVSSDATVSIITTETSASWVHLENYGVIFPSNDDSMLWKVDGYGPATMNDMAGDWGVKVLSGQYPTQVAQGRSLYRNFWAY